MNISSNNSSTAPWQGSRSSTARTHSAFSSGAYCHFISDSVLLDLPLFQSFTSGELEMVRKFLRVKTVRAGAILLLMDATGGGIHVLIEGAVKVCIGYEGSGTGSDTEMIVAFCRPGDVLGEIDALDGQGHSATVIAVNPSQFLWMSVTDFNACQRAVPQISRNLLRILAQRERRSTDRSNALASLNLAGRLARQLLLFTQDFSVQAPDKSFILTIRPTQAEIAALIGSSRACVNRILAHFKKQGHISIESGGYMVIHDLEALRGLCNGLQSPTSEG